MKRFLPDTNIWIALARGDRALQERMAALRPSQILACSIVRAELMFGARKSARVNANLEGFVALLAPFLSVPFDDAAAERYGMIRAALETAGTPIGANNLLIASIALSHDCVMVTRNCREFERVPGLRTEVW